MVSKVQKKKQAPIYLSKADVDRAYRKVKEFERLIERGKTPKQIFYDLCRLIEVGK